MILQLPFSNPVNDPILAIIRPAEEPKPEEKQPVLYTIKQGDTLTSIADAHSSSVGRLWSANPELQHPDQIEPEKPLKIPENDDVLADRPMPVNIESTRKVPVQQVSPRSGGFSNSGNTYAPGYCTYGVKMWRPDIPNRLGDASQWYYNAQRLGMSVGSTPRVGAVAVAYGNHVALVIGVSGSSITIKEMNYSRLWDVNIRTVSASQFRYIY